ncbi:uncharacterized protein LOC106670288 [Cimex lectularius]|uniref:Uncharacterized protein n=1 Tax=Cimex lectularius TaxID=79782 RepID=A0A8I6S4F5_CIMLE|nr:uncharacterized protein LOC106670288 [Cimex lectularius]XP_014255961.1 uncharacterized protein LOC106670288 [Cimex lectularius]
MENKASLESDEIEIVDVVEKPLTNVLLQLNFYKNLEQFSHQVPFEKEKFVEFVKANFTCYYDDRLINTVWNKLHQSCKQPFDPADEPICLSSDEESSEGKRPKIDNRSINDSKEEVGTPRRKEKSSPKRSEPGKNGTKNNYLSVKNISLLIDSQVAGNKGNLGNKGKTAKRKSSQTSTKKCTEKSKSQPKNKSKMTDTPKRTNNKIEPEELRRKLLIDKLIEVTLLTSKEKRKKKKDTVSPNCKNKLI